MSESQDLSKPIIDPILLITEGSASLPSCSSDVGPLDSLKDFDKICTVNVFAKLHERDQQRISQQRLLEAYQEGVRNEEGNTRSRKQHTVLSKINDQWTRGPISILHKALTNKLRVKVWVRNHSTVRSILTGFVAAFDKHLNLALVDVDEAICLRKDDVKSTTLTPEQDLKDLRPVHNEQDYLAIANEAHNEIADDDEHQCSQGPRASTVVEPRNEQRNEVIRIDAELVVEKATNDSEEMYNNNDVSHDHSPGETDGDRTSTATAEAEKVQTTTEKPPDKKTAIQAGSDLTKETKQNPRNSEEQQQGKNFSEESLTKTESPAIVAPAGEISEKETLTSQVKKRSRDRSRKKSKGQGQKETPTLSQRFIPQLFVRGEQVVMIAFADI